MSNYTRNSLISLSVLTLVLALIFGGMLAFPRGARINRSLDDATVNFLINRDWVWQNEDCVTVQWATEAIQAIYINGRGTVGLGTEEFCRTETQSAVTLRVIVSDSSIIQLSLNVPLVWEVPLFWVMSILIGVCVITMLYMAIPKQVKTGVSNTFRRLKPIFNILQIVTINLVVVLVLLEIAVRLYIGMAGTDRQKAMFLYDVDQLRQQTQLRALPFLNYGTSGEIVNNLGYRNVNDTVIPKPDDTYRIVALGGSTTYGLLMENFQAYPAQLERILQEDYGYEQVEVINAGVIGYDSWNSLVNLSFRTLELEPDMIIIYHATNDMHPREQLLPECYRGVNEHRGLNPEAAVLQLNAQTVSPSALHRFAFITFGWMENPLALVSNTEPTIPCYYESLESAMPASERTASNPPIYFERNMESMVLLAQGYDIDVMLATWAYDREVSGAAAEPYWQLGIEEHNRITASLAAEYDTLFLDFASTDIRDDSRYWLDDDIHQSLEGHSHQAELFAEYLDSTGLLTQE